MVDPEQSFPRKSRNYLYAQSVFFTQFNDIDFYIEDEHKESLYFSILSRLFPGVRIDRIFPLGGKTAVIEHAQASRKDRPSVHLVDKDFDDLLGATVTLPTVIYLDRYSLENYILEPLAICRFIVAEKPTLTEAAVKMRFDVDDFLRQSVADLRWLFFCFFLVQKHDLGIQNTSQSVARFSHGAQRWRIESTRVKQYERRVIAAVANKNIDVATARRTYAGAFELNRRSRFSGANVSGKYLLALLLQRIASLFHVRGTDLDSATYRIAEYCTLVALRNIQEQIAKRLAAHSSRTAAS